MTPNSVLDPSELLEVVANIGGGWRWRRKAALIAIIGRTGEPVEIGIRELAERASIGLELTRHLLAELATAKVLTVIHTGSGSRAAAYAVNARLSAWAGVPWIQPVRVVELFTFHMEHRPRANPDLRAVSGPQTARNPDLRAVSGPQAARKKDLRAVSGPQAARKKRFARGVRALDRAQMSPEPQEGFITVDSDISSLPLVDEPKRRTEADIADFGRVVSVVRSAAGAPFIEGRPRAMLAELVAEVGADQVIEWAALAPVTGAPRFIQWLADCRFADPSELVADARAQHPSVSPEPSPTPAVFTGWDDDEPVADRSDVAALAASARAALRSVTSPPDDDTIDNMRGAHP